MNLIDELSAALEGRSSMIPVHLQVLITLRFLATGSYQLDLALNMEHPVSQSTVSRCTTNVTRMIQGLLKDRYIRFPNTPEERQRVSQSFLPHIRIPGVIGLIDCFVVKMKKPHLHEENYFHHKHQHSMNVQAMCDNDSLITNLRICPGRNHDQFIWNHSLIKRYLEHLRRTDPYHYYILGKLQ